MRLGHWERTRALPKGGQYQETARPSGSPVNSQSTISALRSCLLPFIPSTAEEHKTRLDTGTPTYSSLQVRIMSGHHWFKRASVSRLILLKTSGLLVSRGSFSRPHGTALGPFNPIGLHQSKQLVPLEGVKLQEQGPRSAGSDACNEWVSPARTSERLAVCQATKRDPGITISGARVFFLQYNSKPVYF